MRSDKAVKRNHRSVYRRSRLQHKRKAILAKRRSVVDWFNSTVSSELKKTVTAVHETAASLKKFARKKNNKESTENPIVAKAIFAQNVEKKAVNVVEKEQAKKENQQKEIVKRKDQARKAEEERQKRQELEEKKRFEKQQLCKEEAAKVEAFTIRETEKMAADEKKVKDETAAEEEKAKQASEKQSQEEAVATEKKAKKEQQTDEKNVKKEPKKQITLEEKVEVEAKKQGAAEKKAPAKKESQKEATKIEGKQKVVAEVEIEKQIPPAPAQTEQEAEVKPKEINHQNQEAILKSSKKNRKYKKSHNSISEDEVVSKQVNYDECAEASTANGKKLNTQLVLEINENALSQDAPHTKCSTDSGFTDFPADKRKKGQQNHSADSLSSNKSSSNDSISEIPENESAPKTLTPTPINAPITKQGTQNDDSVMPIQESTKFAQSVANFFSQIQSQYQKTETTPLRHIHIEPIVPLNLPPKIERPKPRERSYKLLPRDIQYCAHMIETHGEDYEAMAKDSKNVYLDTSDSLKRKIRIFRESPQYEVYLKAKTNGVPIESIA